MRVPLEDPVEEGRRLVELSEVAGEEIRVTGGVGIALRCPSAAVPSLARLYADVDLVGRSKRSRAIQEMLEEAGYKPDTAFNAVHGARRLFFWDAHNDRQLDIFLDKVEMCHTIDLTQRLTVDQGTLSLADLLLMKLQIVETNEKDLKDAITLLRDHELTEDDSGINLTYLRRLTSGDWGLWKTVTMVTGRVAEQVDRIPDFPDRAELLSRISRFLGALNDSEKTMKWRMRARLGEKVRWYELPEEVR